MKKLTLILLLTLFPLLPIDVAMAGFAVEAGGRYGMFAIRNLSNTSQAVYGGLGYFAGIRIRSIPLKVGSLDFFGGYGSSNLKNSGSASDAFSSTEVSLGVDYRLSFLFLGLEGSRGNLYLTSDHFSIRFEHFSAGPRAGIVIQPGRVYFMLGGAFLLGSATGNYQALKFTRSTKSAFGFLQIGLDFSGGKSSRKSY